MLISRRGNDLVLIEQNEHGRLAGDIAAHWGNAQFAGPLRRESALAAAAMHDEGWREADAQPLFNAAQARPLHFLEIDMEDHVPLYGRGVDRVFEHDPYAGLLVSMHWTGLYRSRWGVQSGGVDFKRGSSKLEQLQDAAVAGEEQRWIEIKQELMRDTRRSDLEAGLWHSYDLLQGWDLLALYLPLFDVRPADSLGVRPLVSTLRSIDQDGGPYLIEAMPREIAGERADLVLRPVADGIVTVDPYPFDADTVEFQVSGRAIPDRRYASAQEAADTIAQAPEITLTCQMKRA